MKVSKDTQIKTNSTAGDCHQKKRLWRQLVATLNNPEKKQALPSEPLAQTEKKSLNSLFQERSTTSLLTCICRFLFSRKVNDFSFNLYVPIQFRIERITSKTLYCQFFQTLKSLDLFFVEIVLPLHFFNFDRRYFIFACQGDRVKG